MPPRKKVESLPREVKEWLDQALVDGNFSRYEALEEELRQRGYNIGKSALNRYGQEFEARLASLKIATEQARAIAQAAGDEENVMGDALTRLAQEKIMQLLLKLEVDGDKVSFSALTRAIADLNRSAVTVKKYAAEVREKVEAAVKSVKDKSRAGEFQYPQEAVDYAVEVLYGLTR